MQALNPAGRLKIEAFPLGPFETNAWLLVPAAGPSTLVDPGMDAGPLLDLLQGRGIRIGRVLLTHGHLDHVAGCAEVVRRHHCPIHLHPGDLFLYQSLVDHGVRYGFMLEPAPVETLPLQDGGALPLGEGTLEVVATPGHSPGGVCFRFDCSEGSVLICGDTLFAGSFGRTDLPGASFTQLKRSIQERVFTLPGHTRLLPGHGPETTVENERRHNPILVCDSGDEA